MNRTNLLATLVMFAALLATLTYAPQASAQSKTNELKVAVVDLQEAVASTKEGKSAKSKLESLTKKKQKELDDKVDKIKKMEEELEKQMPLMSDEGKKDALAKYRKAMMELQKIYVDNQSGLAKKKSELLEPILNKMGKVIKDIALSEGYTLVLDKGIGGSILYHLPAFDITPEVVKRYNQSK